MAVLTVAACNSCRTGALLRRQLRLSPRHWVQHIHAPSVHVCGWLSSENYAETSRGSFPGRPDVCRLRRSPFDPGGLISRTQQCVENEGIIATGGRTARLVCG